MSTGKQILKIPDEDITPLVAQLLGIIQEQAEEIQLLKDEIARLKNQKPKPKIKPSNLDKNTDKKNKEPEKVTQKKEI